MPKGKKFRRSLKRLPETETGLRVYDHSARNFTTVITEIVLEPVQSILALTASFCTIHFNIILFHVCLAVTRYVPLF